VPAQPGTGPYGALGSPDANGIRLPSGFTSRVIARSGQRVGSTSYTWHNAPDGGACYTDGTGWIYVSNSEINPSGGASAVKFSSTGAITGAYRILSNTRQNCAGGKTPWNTWLSCEEVDRGYVYETDPWGAKAAVRRDAMGRFKHEAAAADPVRQVVYLTEDVTDGCFYRFRPTTWGDLSSGTLEVLVAGTGTSGPVTWARVPDPSGATATRSQVSGAKHFNGGEGCYYANDTCWFTTKGDNRVWQYNAAAQTIELAYDDSLVTSGTAPPHRGGQRHRLRLRRPLRRRGRRQHGDLRHHPRRRRRPLPAHRRPVRLGDHRPGFLPGRHPPLLLQPARHQRQLLGRHHLRGERPVPRVTAPPAFT
jgi:hypothetical protein